jgi:hypothetical protein
MKAAAMVRELLDQAAREQARADAAADERTRADWTARAEQSRRFAKALAEATGTTSRAAA